MADFVPYGTNKILDMLVYDNNLEVRKAVAKKGYGLDKLVEDSNMHVRIAVAEQGYGLDKLVEDRNSHVRIAVAEQGYGLDRLVNDENEYVCDAVKKYLKDNKYENIDEWKKDNPDKRYHKDDKSRGEER